MADEQRETDYANVRRLPVDAFFDATTWARNHLAQNEVILPEMKWSSK